MSVCHERLVSIGTDAAREIVGNIAKVDVASATNEYGHPAYYFELRVKQDEERGRYRSARGFGKGYAIF